MEKVGGLREVKPPVQGRGFSSPKKSRLSLQCLKKEKYVKRKKALVTGSSRGIGRKIVETFLANGAEVWGLCSKPSAAKPELEAFAKENGTVFHEICANVGDSQVLSEVVKAALAEAGNFDVLVNNAGITRDGLSFRMKMEDWQNVLNVNLTGTFVVTQIVSNAMLRARAGSIINMKA